MAKMGRDRFRTGLGPVFKPQNGTSFGFFGQIRTRRGAENGPGPVFDRLRTGFWMGDAKFAKMLEKCGDQAFFSISKQNRPNRLKSTKKNAQQCFLF